MAFILVVGSRRMSFTTAARGSQAMGVGRVVAASCAGIVLTLLGLVDSGSAQEPPAPAPAPFPASPSPPEAPSVERRLAELEAEVARLRAEATARAAEPEDPIADPASAATDERAAELAEAPPFRIYGFGEVGLQRAWGSLFDLGLGVTDETTFVLGSVNVFFDFQPEPDWRFLTEVRLTLFPGASPSLDFNSGELSRIDPAVLDTSSPNSGFEVARWSGIVLERAQIEWTPLDEISVRTGLFLTPYGIWNVDHGSPARIMIWEPLIVTVGLMNERQLGVELFGRAHLLPWELGYSLYVSNGQGEAQVIDHDDDKAVGGRVFLSRTLPDPVQLGVSAYHGSSEKVVQDLGVRPDGSFGLVRTLSERAYSTVVGADFSLDVGGFRLRTEVLARWLLFQDGARRQVFGVPAADTLALGGYVLAGYRFADPGLEPFVVFEVLRIPLRILEGAVLPGAGLNLHFTPAASLRFQYSYVRTVDFGDAVTTRRDLHLHSVASRLVLAF
jgi:hypothetical protein